VARVIGRAFGWEFAEHADGQAELVKIAVAALTFGQVL
jgi:hypothetical protein